MNKILFSILCCTAANAIGMSEQVKKATEQAVVKSSNESNEIASVLFWPSQNAVACNFSFGAFKDMTVVQFLNSSLMQAFTAGEEPVALPEGLKKAYEAIAERARRCLEAHRAMVGVINHDDITVTFFKDNKHVIEYALKIG